MGSRTGSTYRSLAGTNRSKKLKNLGDSISNELKIAETSVVDNSASGGGNYSGGGTSGSLAPFLAPISTSAVIAISSVPILDILYHTTKSFNDVVDNLETKNFNISAEETYSLFTKNSFELPTNVAQSIVVDNISDLAWDNIKTEMNLSTTPSQDRLAKFILSQSIGITIDMIKEKLQGKKIDKHFFYKKAIGIGLEYTLDSFFQSASENEILDNNPSIVYNQMDSAVQKVCDYFYLNPKPNMYIRELPIQVHTKFIENNEAIIRELLDILISNEINSLEFDFKKRFNLKYDQFLIRVKVLDKNILLKNNLNNSFLDFSLPLDLFEKLNLNVDKVFIVENKMNFLTFPNIENSIIISGSGNGVNILKNASWLNEKQIYYWGDIDSHGFAILSSFRNHFSNVNSLFMDFITYNTFEEFSVEGIKTVQETFSNLTDEELKVFNYVHSNNLRLEQERISQEYIINNLKNE